MLALTTAGSVAGAQAASAPAGVTQASSATATDAKTATDSTPKAAPAADSTPNFFRDITANAFVSFGFEYNLNNPADRAIGLRFFDNVSNNLGIDGAELVVQKTVSKPGDAGFRIDLVAGTALPKAQAAGLSLGTGGDLQQAFVSYIAPIGTGLRFDVGKFVTPLGYELIEGYDGYNDNYSRGLLFNYAIPLTHTGAKASYTVSSQMSVAGYVVNGWDNAIDNNNGKSVIAQIGLTPAPPLAIYFNYIAGPEKTDTNGFVRQVGDLVATYKVSDVFGLGLNADYGIEDGASLVTPGESAKWYGVAGYARMGPSTGASLALRAEAFTDQGGTRLGTGIGTHVWEFTATPTYKFNSNFVVRVEGRYDSVNQPIFTDDNGVSKKSQGTIGLNAIFVF
jgi:predicted porin